MAKVLEVGQVIEAEVLAQFAGSWPQLWEVIQRQSRASLEWWLLFANAFGTSFLALHPIYEIDLDQCVLMVLGQELDKCRFSRPTQVQLIVELGGQIDVQMVQQILNIRRIDRLDLHASTISLSVLRVIRQSLEYGALRTLKQLCLPRQGPAELKPLLDRTWPHSLEYIESPRKVTGYKRAEQFHPRYAIHLKINASRPTPSCRSCAYRVNG